MVANRSPHRRREALSLVERGWAGARQCSLTLETMGIPVTHLMKGYLSRELRAMIHPYPHIRIASIPRPVFRMSMWGVVIWRTVTRRIRWLIVDQERTLKELAWWSRLWRVTLVAIRETNQGYELWVNGVRQPLASVFGDPA